VELWVLSQIRCNFAFISCKQPVVAKSVGETELIAQNRVGDYVEWAREILFEFGYPQETVPMYVDSQCAMQMLQQGTGSFKSLLHKLIGWNNSKLLNCGDTMDQVAEEVC
jgi:hypothetical protein